MFFKNCWIFEEIMEQLCLILRNFCEYAKKIIFKCLNHIKYNYSKCEEFWINPENFIIKTQMKPHSIIL
jgi:hypothetical protein